MLFTLKFFLIFELKLDALQIVHEKALGSLDLIFLMH